MVNIPKYLIIHESDSEFGNVPVIDRWHRERGWTAIGYHFVIENGFGESVKKFVAEDDGKVSKGRRENAIGSHAYGMNKWSLGICLVGKHGKFTEKQIEALHKLCVDLCKKYNLKAENIIGHCETPYEKIHKVKKCPELDMKVLREEIELLLEYGK